MFNYSNIMSDTQIQKFNKNINIDGVENCNLLCKLIIDYLPSKKCVIKEIDSPIVSTEPTKKTSYIEYPSGSFINYKDTNYEATSVFFFSPSRHFIDGERYDFEVNIYHGNITLNNKNQGLVSHIHYNIDTESELYNKKYHYHDDKGNEVHDQNIYQSDSKKNVVTCILFNRDPHKGTNTNVFFNQFINNEKFKNNNIGDGLSLDTHKNWSLEDLLPKRRSFFLYEDIKGDEDNNIYILFDSVNTIDQGILDIMREHTINLEGVSQESPTHGTILYKSNVEVITDNKYKSDMREQIKQLLSLHRDSVQLSSADDSRDYYNEGTELYSKFSGASDFTDYRENLYTAMKLSDKWEDWSEGKKQKKLLEVIYNDFKNLNEVKDLKQYYEIDFESNITKLRELYEKDILGITSDNVDLITLSDGNITIDDNIKLRNINTIRKNLLFYNKIFTNVEKVEKIDSKSYVDDDISNYFIEEAVTELDLHNMLLNLNNLVKQDEEIIIITGNKNNINVRKLDTNMIESNDGFFEEMNDGFIIPKNTVYRNPPPSNKKNYDVEVIVSDDLVPSKLRYKDKMYGVKYTFHDVGNDIIFNNSLTKDEIDKLQVWRFLIQMDPTLSYSSKVNIFQTGKFFKKVDKIEKIFNETPKIDINYLSAFEVNTDSNSDNQELKDEDIEIFKNRAFQILPQDKTNLKDELFLGEVIFSQLFYNVSTRDENDYMIKLKVDSYGDGNDEYREGQIKEVSDVEKTGNNMNIIGYTLEFRIRPEIILKNLITYLGQEPNIKNKINIRGSGVPLTTTIDGDKCQKWNSNHKHDESSFWNPFMSKVLFGDKPKQWDELNKYDKDYLRDGLIKFRYNDGKNISNYNDFVKNMDAIHNSEEPDEEKDKKIKKEIKNVKWESHNQCRNPGNSKSSPWCYTTNPRKRWQYCVKPDHTPKLARGVLLLVMVFALILAYTMVKVIFKKQYLDKFISYITGSGSGGKGGE